MAINQVIHGSNRVVENPNRYKLNAVSGQANTYDLEKMPGIITDNGTPYNKIILDKLDNILSYLKPNVVKLPFGVYPIIVSNYHLQLDNISFSASSNTEYTFNTTNILPDGTSPTITYNIYRVNKGSATYSTSWTNLDINNVFIRTTKSSAYGLQFNTASGQSYITIDFNKQKNGTIYLGTDNTSRIQVFASNNGITYTQISSFSSIESSIDFSGYRYLQIKNTTSSGDTIRYLYMDIEDTKIDYQNQFTLDNNVGFTNNQRVLVETPNGMSLDDVTSNTLNDVEIDTLLQPSTKYELIYKEDTDKFELGKLSDKILYDITLNEAVNQVDLTGISDILKDGKVYSLIIIGKLNTENDIDFGSNNVGDLRTSDSSNLIFFTPYTYNNRRKIKGIGCYSSGVIQIDSYIESYEYIKCSTSSVTFNVGTRIIIKEVA